MHQAVTLDFHMQKNSSYYIRTPHSSHFSSSGLLFSRYCSHLLSAYRPSIVARADSKQEENEKMKKNAAGQ